MGELRVGIIMNGVTGRMGTRQHLDRSVAAIIKEGGITLGDGRILTVDPILVGRNPDKLRSLASKYGIDRWTTNLDEALNNPDDTIYFDAQTTDRRAEAIRAAIAAGNTSSVRSRPRSHCPKPSNSRRWRARQASRTVSSRTSCSCQGS